MSYPNAPAKGATYLNASPIWSTSVFELLIAAARLFVKWIVFSMPSLFSSPAANFIEVIASVTISEVRPNSRSPAAAKLSTGPKPAIDSFAPHPARPI